MKKLTIAFLVALVALVPVLAAAQTGGGAGGTQAPGSPSMDKPKPGGADQPSGSPSTPGDPAASPPGGGDTLSQHKTKAACEKAGGMWAESTQRCNKK